MAGSPPLSAPLVHRERATIIALCILAAWLWFPALMPVHVEGFSAAIQSIGIHLAGGDLQDFDQAYPFDTEFYTLSRLGMNLLTGWLTALSGDGGLALSVLSVTAFVLLIVTIFLLAKQWTRASTTGILALLVLFPGISENAFFFNDNVLSAALAFAALVLVGWRATPAVALLAGLCFGSAILTRTDAALLTPALLLVLSRERTSVSNLALCILCGGIGTAGTVLSVCWAFHTTPFDILQVASYSVDLWERPWPTLMFLLEAMFFLGLPVALLATRGAIAVIFRKDVWTALLLIGVPVLYLIVYQGKLWQSRQLLPLAPFVLALALHGWALLSPLVARNRITAASLAAYVLVVVAVPPFAFKDAFVFSDGPRAVLGRLWMPLYWVDWQNRVRTNFAEIEKLASEHTSGTELVLTNDWDADRYTHLVLQEAGFTLSSTETNSSCGPVTETFRRADREILHIRLHLPVLSRYALPAMPILFDTYAQPCLDAHPDAPVRYISAWPQTSNLLGVTSPDPSDLIGETRPWYKEMTLITLDAQQVADLRRYYGAVAEFEVRRGMIPAPMSRQDLLTQSARLSAQIGFLSITAR